MAEIYTPSRPETWKGSNLPDGKDSFPQYSIVRCRVDTDVQTTMANGDVVHLLRLPKGARVNANDSYCLVSGAVFATSLTVDIGTDTDDNILADDLDINAAGVDAFDTTNDYELTAEEDVIMTLTAAGALQSGVTVDVYLAVSLP